MDESKSPQSSTLLLCDILARPTCRDLPTCEGKDAVDLKMVCLTLDIHLSSANNIWGRFGGFVERGDLVSHRIRNQQAMPDRDLRKSSILLP